VAYVFCLFAEKDPRRVDPLDLAQWEFRVLSRAILEDSVGQRKRLGLRTLLRLSPKSVSFDSLRGAVLVAGGRP